MSTQNNEDVWVRDLFAQGHVGTAVEVGAGDGETLSNTLWMEQEGWDVLCIEPDHDLFQKLSATRKRTVRAACADYDKDDDRLITYMVPGSAHHDKVTVLKEPPALFQEWYMRGSLPVDAENDIVRTARLDALLDESGIGSADFVSIDVDGIELQVLMGFDPERWKTKVIVVENPFDNQDILKWHKEHGFRREIARLGGLNDIYVREDL